MKYNTGRLRTAILGSLAVTAATAVTVTLSGCSSVTSAQPAAPHAAAQSDCSLSPSPPPGFNEQKAPVGGIGINYVRGGHGPTLLLVAGYPQTATFPQDIKNDAAYQKTKLTMPVMAIGASNSLGSSVPNQVRQYATNVTSVVFPDSGHWIYEEHPGQSAKLLLAFLG